VTSIHIARQRLGKHISAEAQARNNRTYIARPRIRKQPFSIIERLGFLRQPYRGVIKGQNRSFELVVDKHYTVVKKWVEFWILQSQVIEEKTAR
jgi:hypothetical protein